jgi:hypothetical protein
VDATQPNSKAAKQLQTLQAVAEKETIIAILMALVAMLGMVTAYRTATAEEEVLLKESRLTQSRFLELTKREEALVRFADSGRFEVAKGIHLQKARDLQERAEKARPADRGKASLLELQAQEEVALARIQQPYLNFVELPGIDDKTLSTNQIIDRYVSEELAASGLGSKWDKRAGSIWQSLEEQIRKSQRKLVGLALTVVVFVVALGCLSLAELWCQRRSLRLRIMALGIVVTLAAVSLLDRHKAHPGRELLRNPLQGTAHQPASPGNRAATFRRRENAFGVAEESFYLLCCAVDCAGCSLQRVGGLSLYVRQHRGGQERGKGGRIYYKRWEE